MSWCADFEFRGTQATLMIELSELLIKVCDKILPDADQARPIRRRGVG